MEKLAISGADTNATMPDGAAISKGQRLRGGWSISLRSAAFVVGLCAPFSVWAEDIHVGASRPLQTLAQALAAAKPGDRLLLDPEVYVDQAVQVRVPITIEGNGDGATLRMTVPVPNRKAIIVSTVDLVVRNIRFEGARISVADGNNGSGIRSEAGNLTVESCAFVNNQDGILTGADLTATIKISNSVFEKNGAGDGYTHAVYVGTAARLVVSSSRFEGTQVGHDIKSRAMETIVKDTTLDDGVTGTTSYAVDLPNGGMATLENLRITQGPNTQNGIMVAYGGEQPWHKKNALRVNNSTFVNRVRAGATGLKNFIPDVTADVRHTTFEGVATPVSGAAKMTDGK